MNKKEKIQAEIKATIGEGIHASLRKYCDSRQSSVVWNAIHELPKGEWGTCCDIVASYLMEQFDIKEKKKA